MTTTIGLSELSMINDMHRLDIISHNLSNANTIGFKREITITHGFDHVLQGEMRQLGGLFPTGRSQPLPGIKRVTDFSTGALRFTGNPLDVAIEGDAYFEMRGIHGLRYSRWGSFSVDESARLVNGNGLVVSGEEGEIMLRGGEISIDRDGRIHEDGDYLGQLKLVRFANASSLSKAGNGMMVALNGELPEPASNFGVLQGYQEASNVRVMDEMVNMMAIFRHFEANSRVIKSYDEMMGAAISTIAEF